MRYRDTKLNILLTILVFIAVVMFNAFYIMAYTDRIQDLTYDNAVYETRLDMISIDDNIIKMKYEFKDNNSTNVEVVLNPKENYINEFIYSNNEYHQTCIRKASAMELDSTDDTYYLYFLDDNNRLGKTELKNVFNIINDKFFIFEGTNGKVIYNNDLTSKHFFTYINANGDQDVSKIKELINNHDAFAGIFSINGIDEIVTGVEFGPNIYLSRFYSTEAYQLEVRNLYVMSAIIVSATAVSIVLIIIGSFYVMKKQDKLIAISRFSARRNDAIIIRAKRNGKIIEINHDIKEFDSHPERFKNIFDFITIDGHSGKDIVRTRDKKICLFDLDGKKKYIEFIVFSYNFTYYLIGSDVTNDYLFVNRLKDLTSKNVVTDLPNYYSLMEDFNKIKENSFNKILTFFAINILEYTEISKLFSASVIDDICRVVRDRVMTYIGEDNLLYHTDKDKFIVVLTSTIKEENNKIIEYIKSALHETFPVKTHTLYVKFKYASYELTGAMTSKIEFDQMNDRLSAALEVSKTSINRDFITYDATIQNMIDYKIQMQADLVKAIDQNELMMYYQPQYDVEENRIAGFESLIRWNNPKYISTSPQVYIELAEQNGLIIEIGNFIIREVFKSAKVFEQYGVHISINVSPAQLLQAGFTNFLLEEFERNELKPGTIAIEITETFLMENFGVIIEKLVLLRNKGFSIHLDDFGTGYSSLQYLKELPIDTIKTDKEFIKNLENDKSTQIIIKGIISLAKSIDLKVISEGVETKAQADILKRAGTDYFQGYLISKAVPMDQAIDMVKNGVDIYGKKAKK